MTTLLIIGLALLGLYSLMPQNVQTIIRTNIRKGIDKILILLHIK